VTAQAALTISTYRQSVSEEFRRRALERLYERRSTVNELIVALEKYQEERRGVRAACIDISVGRKCLSGSAQSRI